MTSLPSHIQQRSIPRAGNALFTIKAIDAGEEVLRVERLLVAVLNQGQLTRACEWCFVWVPEGEGEAKTKLRACQGCGIVRYCSKTCQSSSWQHHHRHECKIFKKLYPNVLPNTVRILLQLLLRRKSKSLPDTEWQALLNLQSHIDDFRSSTTKNTDGLNPYQTIELMSQALQTYSTTKEEPLSLLQSLTATTLINALTLTTPHFDPLGLTLSPQIALLNHSCTPNTAITYSHATLSLRSLTPIPANSELTISYIDTTYPTPTRQSELQERYFFTCTCPFCSNNLTNGIPDPPSSTSSDDDYKARSVKAIELQNEAATKPTPEDAAPLLAKALDLLSAYPPTSSATILHSAFLTALSLHNYPLALSYKLREYFSIDPIHYEADFHPVRIVHKWVLLRLIVQIAGMVGEGDASVSSLMKFEVDWQVVVFYLFREIEEAVGKSHGKGSFFAEEVEAFGGEIGMVGKRVGGGSEELKAREWRKLRGIGEGVGGGRRVGELKKT